MEESYETFEEELGPPRREPLPQKPVRQIRRPEMYASKRKIKEESASVVQPQPVPKTLPREPSFPRTMSLRKSMSIQNLTQIEKPWENVTLNRCLFVAITILVLTSGFQRLHETLRGRRPIEEEEEEAGLTIRHSGTSRHKVQPPEPGTSLWEVMFWWLPDFDEGGQAKRGRSKRGATVSRGLRNRPQPDKKLTKQREGKLKNRRAKKVRDEEIKDKKVRDEEIKDKRGRRKQGKLREAAEEEDKEHEEEAISTKHKRQEEKKLA
ncbi:uncharacterized protein ACN63O_009602 [Diretmus argenteus]